MILHFFSFSFFSVPATAQACADAATSVMNCLFNLPLEGLAAEQKRGCILKKIDKALSEHGGFFETRKLFEFLCFVKLYLESCSQI